MDVFEMWNTRLQTKSCSATGDRSPGDDNKLRIFNTVKISGFMQFLLHFITSYKIITLQCTESKGDT
jgi:hypothetical protein